MRDGGPRGKQACFRLGVNSRGVKKGSESMARMRPIEPLIALFEFTRPAVCGACTGSSPRRLLRVSRSWHTVTPRNYPIRSLRFICPRARERHLCTPGIINPFSDGWASYRSFATHTHIRARSDYARGVAAVRSNAHRTRSFHPFFDPNFGWESRRTNSWSNNYSTKGIIDFNRVKGNWKNFNSLDRTIVRSVDKYWRHRGGDEKARSSSRHVAQVV